MPKKPKSALDRLEFSHGEKFSTTRIARVLHRQATLYRNRYAAQLLAAIEKGVEPTQVAASYPRKYKRGHKAGTTEDVIVALSLGLQTEALGAVALPTIGQRGATPELVDVMILKQVAIESLTEEDADTFYGVAGLFGPGRNQFLRNGLVPVSDIDKFDALTELSDLVGMDLVKRNLIAGDIYGVNFESYIEKRDQFEVVPISSDVTIDRVPNPTSPRSANTETNFTLGQFDSDTRVELVMENGDGRSLHVVIKRESSKKFFNLSRRSKRNS